jgi:peptidoglycan L-alanyl-D-glutamate endopeptidase CwlK
MARFGKSSLTRLETCHEDLQLLFLQVVSTFDCSIICGYRGEEEQNKAFNAKPQLSKLKFPDSKHNSYPSEGIDVIPWPVDWHDLKRMHYFAGYVKATAEQLKKDQLISHDIRWGGDWDSDTEVNDQEFIDLPHFELI